MSVLALRKLNRPSKHQYKSASSRLFAISVFAFLFHSLVVSRRAVIVFGIGCISTVTSCGVFKSPQSAGFSFLELDVASAESV